MTDLLASLVPAGGEGSSSAGAPIAYLRLVAAAFVVWYALYLWVWSKFRAEDQPWSRILFGGWVLVDSRAFQREGFGWLRVVRWGFLLVVLPLLVVLFWKWPVG
jgi:hypothetical protein